MHWPEPLGTTIGASHTRLIVVSPFCCHSPATRTPAVGMSASDRSTLAQRDEGDLTQRGLKIHNCAGMLNPQRPRGHVYHFERDEDDDDSNEGMSVRRVVTLPP